ncbi:MAG TPA: (2Fe-2S)-binding protein [Gaiellaceae bacterium]|jgi:aerobic-type carbon monoxide dehydrogenase small subunit (CoxS/CutS family)
MRRIEVEVNGERHEREVEPRRLLSEFLRHDLDLTGTHVGCEHGVCGACTVQLDGEPIRSCLMLAVQANGRSIRTVEALSRPGEPLHSLQQAFHEAHALQCGFCTPGFLMSLEPLLRRDPPPGDDEILEAVAGNLCRCTGYRPILEAVRRAVGDA